MPGLLANIPDLITAITNTFSARDTAVTKASEAATDAGDAETARVAAVAAKDAAEAALASVNGAIGRAVADAIATASSGLIFDRSAIRSLIGAAAVAIDEGGTGSGYVILDSSGPWDNDDLNLSSGSGTGVITFSLTGGGNPLTGLGAIAFRAEVTIPATLQLDPLFSVNYLSASDVVLATTYGVFTEQRVVASGASKQAWAAEDFEVPATATKVRLTFTGQYGGSGFAVVEAYVAPAAYFDS